MSNKNINDLGLFKEKIHKALFQNDNIKNLILGDMSEMNSAQLTKKFNKHVNSHLFVDETVMDTGTYIYYDVTIPIIHTNTKECKVTLYAICHRDVVDGCYVEGYHGNRTDILSRMIEETLLDPEVRNKFGIGEMNLDSVIIYNATRFYGRILTFSVPNFR